MLKREKTVWKATPYWASGVEELKLSSPTASNAITTLLVTLSKIAPSGRHAVGASVLSTLTTSAPLLTIPVQPIAALSILGILTLAVTVQQPQLGYSVTS